MPLNRGLDSFITGGFAGILLFEATFVGLEEDIPNDFQENKLRSRFDFHDVEILDTEEAVTLEDDSFKFFIGQSNSEKSANKVLIAEWDAYAQKVSREGMVPDIFIGDRLIFKRVQIKYGKDKEGQQLNPSNIWCPVGKPGDDVEKLKKAKVTRPGADAEVLNALIVEASAMGVTQEGIKKLISAADAETRKLVAKGGGLVKVLKALVEAKRIEVEDGVYTTV